MSGLNKQGEILTLVKYTILFGVLNLEIYVKRENKKWGKNMCPLFGNIRNGNTQKWKVREKCYTEKLTILQRTVNGSGISEQCKRPTITVCTKTGKVLTLFASSNFTKTGRVKYAICVSNANIFLLTFEMVISKRERYHI